MVIDPTLIGQVDVAKGMTEKGVLIINTTKSPEDIRKDVGFKGKIYTVDATGISIKYLGRNVPNTPMLGALIKVSGAIQMEYLIKKVDDMFLKKLGAEKTKANVDAITEAYGSVKG
jgi:pyruvate ferredoxin oxidoreductase gamma subunit